MPIGVYKHKCKGRGGWNKNKTYTNKKTQKKNKTYQDYLNEAKTLEEFKVLIANEQMRNPYEQNIQ